MSDSQTQQKRSRGRPKKQQEELQVDGVVTAPSTNDRVVELQFQHPNLLSKLAHYMKTANCATITIEFYPELVKFRGIDHFGYVSCCFMINCNKAQSYFSDSPKRVISVGRMELEQSLQHFDTKSRQVCMFINKDTERSKLHIESYSAVLGANRVTQVSMKDTASLVEFADARTMEYVELSEAPSGIGLCLDSRAIKKLLTAVDRKKGHIEFVKEPGLFLKLNVLREKTLISTMEFVDTLAVEMFESLDENERLAIKVPNTLLYHCLQTWLCDRVDVTLMHDNQILLNYHRSDIGCSMSYLIHYHDAK